MRHDHPPRRGGGETSALIEIDRISEALGTKLDFGIEKTLQKKIKKKWIFRYFFEISGDIRVPPKNDVIVTHIQI